MEIFLLSFCLSRSTRCMKRNMDTHTLIDRKQKLKYLILNMRREKTKYLKRNCQHHHRDWFVLNQIFDLIEVHMYDEYRVVVFSTNDPAIGLDVGTRKIYFHTTNIEEYFQKYLNIRDDSIIWHSSSQSSITEDEVVSKRKKRMLINLLARYVSANSSCLILFSKKRE